MPFRFKLDEGFADGVRRISCEQLSTAAAELGAKGGDPVAVHETRKAMKRLRALLRLVRPALGEDAFKAENARFRDLSRLLSGARDRHVMQATLLRLTDEGKGGDVAAPADAVNAMRAVLAQQDEAASKTEQTHFRDAIRRLKSAERHFRSLSLKGAGFELVAKGLKEVYRRGRRDMRQAEHGAGEEAYHDWRKMVQAHWRHMHLLSNAWPKHYEARAALAKELSEVLGDEQDLAVLEKAVAGAMAHGLSMRHQRQLTKVIGKRRRLLRAKALPLGELLYADRPRDFVAAAAVHWTSAKRIAKSSKPAAA